MTVWQRSSTCIVDTIWGHYCVNLRVPEPSRPVTDLFICFCSVCLLLFLTCSIELVHCWRTCWIDRINMQRRALFPRSFLWGGETFITPSPHIYRHEAHQHDTVRRSAGYVLIGPSSICYVRTSTFRSSRHGASASARAWREIKRQEII